MRSIKLASLGREDRQAFACRRAGESGLSHTRAPTRKLTELTVSPFGRSPAASPGANAACAPQAALMLMAIRARAARRMLRAARREKRRPASHGLTAWRTADEPDRNPPSHNALPDSAL